MHANSCLTGPCGKTLTRKPHEPLTMTLQVKEAITQIAIVKFPVLFFLPVQYRYLLKIFPEITVDNLILMLNMTPTTAGIVILEPNGYDSYGSSAKEQCHIG